MSNFMLNLISWVLLLLVILTLYLIDKVNQLTRLQQEALQPPAPEPEAEPVVSTHDVLFERLHGKPLWDAMTGKTVEGFEPTLIEALRPHYEPVLHEHLVATFRDGFDSASQAAARQPTSTRTIVTPRGEVQSWLPAQHLGSIHRTAAEFAAIDRHNPDTQTLQRLKETLDSVSSMLYQRAGLSLAEPLSNRLLDLTTRADAPSSQSASAALPALTDGSATAASAAGIEEYTQQQRQDVAAEQAAEVLEPVMNPTPAQGVPVAAT